MKEIVNRIRALCRSENTSITKIEEELHFANGTIGKWKNGKRMPPLEKVILIANRLDTTPEYILYGEQKEKPDPTTETGLSTAKQKLLSIIDELSDEQCEKLLGIIEEAKKLL